MRRKFFVPVYQTLAKALGPSHWWPGETPFEVMIGAILTQNTNWKNVEKAIGNLRSRGILAPEKLAAIPAIELAPLIRSSGYFNQKAKKIHNLLDWFRKYNYSTELARETFVAQDNLRSELLAINGVGPETADSILCYALNLPVFVVDTYTIRWLARARPENATRDYRKLQAMVATEFENAYPTERDRVAHYNEFHALIVRLSYKTCTKRKPDCPNCPLRKKCATGRRSLVFSS